MGSVATALIPAAVGAIFGKKQEDPAPAAAAGAAATPTQTPEQAAAGKTLLPILQDWMKNTPKVPYRQFSPTQVTFGGGQAGASATAPAGSAGAFGSGFSFTPGKTVSAQPAQPAQAQPAQVQQQPASSAPASTQFQTTFSGGGKPGQNDPGTRQVATSTDPVIQSYVRKGYTVKEDPANPGYFTATTMGTGPGGGPPSYANPQNNVGADSVTFRAGDSAPMASVSGNKVMAPIPAGTPQPAPAYTPPAGWSGQGEIGYTNPAIPSQAQQPATEYQPGSMNIPDVPVSAPTAGTGYQYQGNDQFNDQVAQMMAPVSENSYAGYQGKAALPAEGYDASYLKDLAAQGIDPLKQAYDVALQKAGADYNRMGLHSSGFELGNKYSSNPDSITTGFLREAGNVARDVGLKGAEAARADRFTNAQNDEAAREYWDKAGIGVQLTNKDLLQKGVQTASTLDQQNEANKQWAANFGQTQQEYDNTQKNAAWDKGLGVTEWLANRDDATQKYNIENANKNDTANMVDIPQQGIANLENFISGQNSAGSNLTNAYDSAYKNAVASNTQAQNNSNSISQMAYDLLNQNKQQAPVDNSGWTEDWGAQQSFSGPIH